MSDQEPTRTTNEFMPGALPDQAMLLKLAALAFAGSGAVLTPNAPKGDSAHAISGSAAEMMRIMELRRIEQIADLNSRLDDLDRRSDEALRRADERLTEILSKANRTKDGRVVFEDDDGKIYDEFDNEVGDDEIDWTKWNPSGPSLDEFRIARDQYSAADEFRRQVMEQKERLAMPLSADDLAELDAKVAALEASMPGNPDGREVTTEARSTSAAKSYVDGAGLGNLPGLQPLFSDAAVSSDAAIAPSASPDQPSKPGAAFKPG